MLHRDRRESVLHAPADRGRAGRGRRIEMIDYDTDEPFVDHKGRSRPMYKASRPKPAAWRPSKLTRLILGMFPGVRTMALLDAKAGALYCVLGLAAAITAVMLWVDWSRTFENFDVLKIQPRWLLIHAAAILGAILLFEILRLLSVLDETLRGPAAPRILSALLLPSLSVLYAAPKLVTYWPRLIEATTFAAVVLAVGAVPAALWSIGMAFVRSPVSQRRLGFACVALAVLSVGGLAFATYKGLPILATLLG